MGPSTNTPDITYASLTPVSLADCSLKTSTTILNSAGHSVSDGFNGSHNLAVVQADSTLNEEAISGVTSPEKRQVGRNITNNLKKKHMAMVLYSTPPDLRILLRMLVNVAPQAPKMK